MDVTLFVTRRGVEEAKNLINDYNSGKLKVEPEKLWHAKKIIDSTIHPDTGEPVFLPFRMSCFVPTNLIIVAGMLMPNPSIKSIIFWQWANQSINVAINYSNANKTTEMSLKETAIAYVAAVTTSCGLAVGLTQSVPRLKFLNPAVRQILVRLVPFVAVASAGTVNVYLMRWKEIRDGIDVYDENGNTLGKSQIAGLIALSLTTALPLAIAAFPQSAVIDPLKLESRFWDLKNEKGLRVSDGIAREAILSLIIRRKSDFPLRGANSYVGGWVKVYHIQNSVITSAGPARIH
ncbi:11153_t:CDS:2 [Diversispora eburnea]|uniref:11153_t:CDS:1 n=1 Tax=Diversispora eburnea TaxID=1213867 RepID=A0A9N8VG34_9GLOM|nr:11153_t:CDS:2 [Diversispora eburnea]